MENNERWNADLHNHTTGSDGTQSPLMFLLRASNRGKQIVSMSDHDSVKGYTQLKEQIIKKIEELECLQAESEDKSAGVLGAKRLLELLSNIKLLPSAELITTHKGHIIEVLGYGVNPDILEGEIKRIHEGLVPGSKVLVEGVDRVIKENDLEFDRYVIDNRADFKKLFFHELKKHPENKWLYEEFEGDEEVCAEEFSKKYLEDPDSEFYVDMSIGEREGAKYLRKEILNMLERKSDRIVFDENVIANSHAVVGEFYNELIKHPKNVELLSDDVDNLKKFIYGELYNLDSVFYVDMSPSRPSKEKTIEAIHNAGGIAFLAHPGRYEKQFDVRNEIVNSDLLEGVDGVEVFYPTHSEEMRQFLLGQAKEKDLKVSGGSDDHRAPKDGPEYKIGTVDVPKIPETEWINDYVVDGKSYIEEYIEMKKMIARLRALRGEKEELIAARSEFQREENIIEEEVK